MSEKNIVYLYDVCGLSFDAIAARYNVTVDVIREIVSKPNPYLLQYTPRQRYIDWVKGK